MHTCNTGIFLCKNRHLYLCLYAKPVSILLFTCTHEMQESFPRNIRASFNGFAAASGKLGAILGASCFAPMARQYGKGACALYPHTHITYVHTYSSIWTWKQASLVVTFPRWSTRTYMCYWAAVPCTCVAHALKHVHMPQNAYDSHTHISTYGNRSRCDIPDMLNIRGCRVLHYCISGWRYAVWGGRTWASTRCTRSTAPPLSII